MNSTECLICYEKIKTNNCCITECNHAFCLTCMIKTALKKKECPYCREKILKNEEIDRQEDELEENENYAVEVEVEIFGDMEFSENDEDDSDYEPENNQDLTLIAFIRIGYVTYFYLKEIIEIQIYKYLFYKKHHPDYVNKFKNCNLELFIEIPIFFGYSIECNDNEKRKIYDLFFRDSKDVYSFATAGSDFEQDKHKKNKSNKKELGENIIKKNKNKKIKKEKINKNRSFKF